MSSVSPCIYSRGIARAFLLWETERTTRADKKRWFGQSEARIVAHIEASWLERVERASLERYELPLETFESLEDAGMWR